MKQLYLGFFLFVCFLGAAQESRTSTGDIEGFKLYPNPTLNGKVFIETTLNAPKQVHVFDVLGTRVLQTTLLGNELNVSHLSKGVYILRVFEKDKVATRKLVIK